MESPYQHHIHRLRRDWSRPWRTVGLGLTIFCVLHWWFSQPTEPFFCEPIPGSRFSTKVNIAGLYWTADLDAAHANAKKYGRRVLIAFHGINDTNSAYNERRVFIDSRVTESLSQYILVMLNTDYVPDNFYVRPMTTATHTWEGERFLDFEAKHFNTVETPMYAIVEPTADGQFRMVARFAQARITDKEAFIEFLRTPKPGIVADAWKSVRSLWK